jgi:hypothetical protein
MKLSRRRVNSIVRRLCFSTMNRPLPKLVRIFQLIGAFTIFAVGLWISAHILALDRAGGNKWEWRDFLILFLYIIGPALLFIVGSYLQAVKLKRWPLVLVSIGGVATIILVGGIIMFFFVYIGDKTAQTVVFVDVGLVLLSGCAGIINAVLKTASV